MNTLWGFRDTVMLYYGVDWMILVLVFASVFALGEKKRIGFALAMGSSALGVLFSVQVGSIANGISSFVLFFLNLRGYLKWGR